MSNWFYSLNYTTLICITCMWVKTLSSQVCLTWNKTTGKVQHLGDTGATEAACRAYQAIFNSALFQLPSSCHGASKGLSHSLNWRYAKKKTRGEAQASPSAVGNHSSLYVDVLYWVTCILVAWLLDRGRRGLGCNKHRYVSKGGKRQSHKVTEPICLTHNSWNVAWF